MPKNVLMLKINNYGKFEKFSNKHMVNIYYFYFLKKYFTFKALIFSIF